MMMMMMMMIMIMMMMMMMMMMMVMMLIIVYMTLCVSVEYSYEDKDAFNAYLCKDESDCCEDNLCGGGTCVPKTDLKGDDVRSRFGYVCEEKGVCGPNPGQLSGILCNQPAGK